MHGRMRDWMDGWSSRCVPPKAAAATLTTIIHEPEAAPASQARPRAILIQPTSSHPILQVRKNEPGTISYELCQGDTDPLKLLVYER